MKNLLFVIILVLSHTLALAAPVSGVLRRDKGGLFIVPDGSSNKYFLNDQTPETNNALRRLTSGDYVVGSGDIDEENRVIQLHTVDYVGLKKLLGVWYNSKNIMNFKNYSDLSVYPILGTLAGVSAPGTEIRYSMAPYNGNQWAIFLSNSTATIFATIELFRDTAKLNIYDAQTGNTADTITLTRWRK